MIKIKFIKTEGFKFYHDNPNWQDGDEREIESAQAKYLTETFPDNFKTVEGEKVMGAPSKNKADKGPDKNK
jgi:hypothetical protein